MKRLIISLIRRAGAASTTSRSTTGTATPSRATKASLVAKRERSPRRTRMPWHAPRLAAQARNSTESFEIVDLVRRDEQQRCTSGRVVRDAFCRRRVLDDRCVRPRKVPTPPMGRGTRRDRSRGRGRRRSRRRGAELNLAELALDFLSDRIDERCVDAVATREIGGQQQPIADQVHATGDAAGPLVDALERLFVERRVLLQPTCRRRCST